MYLHTRSCDKSACFIRTPILFGMVAAAFVPTATFASPTPETAATEMTATEDDTALRAELEAMLVTTPASTTPQQPTASGSSVLKLMDISMSALFAVGGSTLDDHELADVQRAGHDPKASGFNLQTLELSLMGAVDPYLNGEAHLAMSITPEGETLVEIEEAFATTRALPAGLQIRAGHYYTEFGRQNNQHAHAWSFIDMPISNQRLLGNDGLRAPGARIAWLTPLPWYFEWIVGVQNARNTVGFLGEAHAHGEEGGHTDEHADEVSETTEEEHHEEGLEHFGAFDPEYTFPRNLLLSTRMLNSFDLARSLTMNLGLSGAIGPNHFGPDNRTMLAGVDLYAKWKPELNDRGWPFVALQAEGIARRLEAGAKDDEHTLLVDYGAYGQIVWGFLRPWTLAVRAEWADSADPDNEDLDRNQRKRGSIALSHFFTEYSKLRLQYNFDETETIGISHAGWLQFEFMMGAHAGHVF